MPDILAGMRVGLVVALIITVVGEMLTSRPGLGQFVMLPHAVSVPPISMLGSSFSA